MKLKWTEFLRSANGGLEVNRLIGGVGGAAYIIGVQAFTAWNMAEGREFDVTAYCLAFGGGLAAIVGGTAGAVAIKDRNVASAQQIERTGVVPSKEAPKDNAPAGTTEDPVKVIVGNTAADPAIVQQADDLIPEYAR